MNSKSFCPQCTADWDRPWYDVCPSCGHRFIGRPWWQAPSFILFLICFPALAIVAIRLMDNVAPKMVGGSLEAIALGISMIGVPIGSLVAAIIFPVRMGKTGVQIIGWAFLWFVVFGAVSFGLTFFSCVY